MVPVLLNTKPALPDKLVLIVAEALPLIVGALPVRVRLPPEPLVSE